MEKHVIPAQACLGQTGGNPVSESGYTENLLRRYARFFSISQGHAPTREHFQYPVVQAERQEPLSPPGLSAGTGDLRGLLPVAVASGARLNRSKYSLARISLLAALPYELGNRNPTVDFTLCKTFRQW